MYFPTAAFATLFALVAIPSPANADIVQPLDKKGKKNRLPKHLFDTSVSFKTKTDVDFTPEQLAIIESAIVESCNESHDTKKIRMTNMVIKKESHAPAFNEEEASLLRPPRPYWGWYWARMWGGGSFGCRFCAADDDDALMDAIPDAFSDVLSKGKMKVWEDTLCNILSQNDAFDDIIDCKINVKVKDEDEEAVLGVFELLE